MAALTVHDDDPGDISCICGLIDPDIEGILLGYGSDSNKDIVDELLRECDKQGLLNARDKIFELSKDKILRCMAAQAAGKEGDEVDENEAHEEAALLASYVEKWQLIPRRAEHKMAQDIIDLIDFTLGSDTTFPSKIVKETSMNKGNLGENVEYANLINMLKNDLAAAKGQVDIQVVAEVGDKQVHSICITTDANDEVSEISVAEPQPQAIAPEPSDVIGDNTLDQTNDNHSTGSSEPVNIFPPDAIQDSGNPRSVRNCPCTNGVVKSVRDTGCQTELVVDMYRGEPVQQVETPEKRIRVNEQNIKGILKWKSLVNNRFRDLENAHEREIIALRAQNRTLAVEAAEGKANRNRKQSQIVRADESRKEIEKMDTREREDNAGIVEDESIWDVPHEQSTPANTKQNKTAGKQGNPGRPRQEKAKQIPKNTQKTQVTPKGAPGRTGKNKQVQSNKGGPNNKQQSYRVDIEMASEEGDCTQMTSSSDSELDPPEQKKQRVNGRVKSSEQASTSRGTASSNTRGSLSSRLRAIAEPPEENLVDMTDCDSSWADAEEEEMCVDQPSERAGNDRPGRNGREKGGPQHEKSVRFADDKGKRGSKREGSPHPVANKRYESNRESESGNGGEGSSDNSDNESFADKVKKSRWLTVAYHNNNKRKEREGAKKRNLKGVKSVLQREIYIQGLDMEGFSSYNEMEELVHSYCVKRGIPVIFMKIIPAKYDRAQVGCKIAVREEEFERVMQEEFWPEDVTVREWRRKPRGGNGYDGYEDGGY